MKRNFMEMLAAKEAEGKFVCVGLDSELGKIPKCAERAGEKGGVSVLETITYFNRRIIEATADIVGCYKPNIAFYEAYGAEGIDALRLTISTIHQIAPSVPVILDAKRADIGSTNNGYVRAAFDYLGADAITLNPYFGQEALKPFLDQKDKGAVILCRTSNPGAGEFQDRVIETIGCYGPRRIPLYQHVAESVYNFWNYNNNCVLVVGATAPSELYNVRENVGDMPILIPGIGAQGGDLEATVKFGKNSRGGGMVINSSRGIILASSGEDFAEAAGHEAEELHNKITECLKGGK